MIYDKTNINMLPIDSYAVIGSPIEHSLSPLIHNSLTESDNYNRILLSAEDLDYAIPILKERLLGFNCTIPHKQVIREYLDEIDGVAEMYGAVNTVKKKNGKLIGYNTDGEGFQAALNRAGMSISNRRVIICGAGGVARVIAYEAVKAGSKVTIYCRSLDKGNSLMNDIKARYNNAYIIVTDKVDSYYDILLNGTPVGMYPNTHAMPVSNEVIDRVGEIFDTIYNPIETLLINTGKHKGLKVSNGLYMLLYQAVAARQIWEDVGYRQEKLDNIIVNLQEKLQEG